MSTVIDWKNEIADIAGSFEPTDTKQSWLNKAARRCGLTLRHITSLYYGHVKDPRHSVATKILSAADQARIERGRKHAAVATEIYRVAAERLAHFNSNRYRDEIDVLERASRIVGDVDSPGT